MKTAILVTAALALYAATGWCYTPPVGIPDPASSWGGTQHPIDDQPPERPSSWTGEEAGYYYVDDDSGCSDSRTYGYPGSARCTIPNPAPAGSYVEVHGTYNQLTAGDIRINGNGTAASWVANSSGPVWIVGQEGSEPTFTGGKTLVYGDFVYVYNINFSGVTSGNVVQISSSSAGYDADYIAIKNCDIAGTSTSGYGVAIGGNDGGTIENLLIYNNHIHDHGPNYDIDQDSHMINVGAYTTKVWILSNNLENSSGSGMQLGPSNPGPTFIYIGRNTVNNSRQSGIWVKYAEDIIISENTVHDIKDRCVGADTSPSKGLGGQYRPVLVWWLNNIVYNTRYGIRVASTDSGYGEVYAIGNILHDSSIDTGGACFAMPDGVDSWKPAAIHFHGASQGRYIVNNTISKAASGIHISTSSGVTTVIEGNIIEDITDPDGYFLFTEMQTLNTWLTYRNNIIYDSGDSNFRRGTTEETFAQWQTSTGLGENSSLSDPVFIDKTTNDYRLQAVSPSNGAGTLSDVYSTFQTLYGLDIKKDLAGTARPQDTTWDIGAYEYTPPGRRYRYLSISGD